MALTGVAERLAVTLVPLGLRVGGGCAISTRCGFPTAERAGTTRRQTWTANRALAIEMASGDR
jgi:hypothetical protein